MKGLSVLISLLALATQVVAAPVMTRFDPKIHGFQFTNSFSDDRIDIVDSRTDGFCAGMAHNALDYFKTNRSVPKQWWLPNRGTPLERQILARQKQANLMSLRRMIELEVNPGGERDTEFFGWGIADRIPELRRFIDAGNPVPIILRGDGTGHHEVLAIGYDMGRYRGDKGNFVTDFTIFVYDPNFPREITRIRPNPPSRNFQHFRENDSLIQDYKWRTWFCDTGYRLVEPSRAIPQYIFASNGRVSGLLFHFDTGADDLRGGKDGGDSYIDLKVTLADGSVQRMPKASLGQRWISDTTQSVFFPMPENLAKGAIRSVEVTHTSNGGLSPDNWTMKSLRVQEVGCETTGEIFETEILSSGLKRFDGSNRTLVLTKAAALPANKTQNITLEFITANDDLRGGNDNLGVDVLFRNGSVQRFENVNQGVQWNNYTQNKVRVQLRTPVDPAEITAIGLRIGNSTSAVASDNWTMGAFTAEYEIAGERRQLALQGQFRFTKSSPKAQIPCLTQFSESRSKLMHLVFLTGEDDLRGGNDNLAIKVNFRTGPSLIVRNVNQSLQWENNKRSDVTLLLDQEVAPEDIVSVELTVDRGGDNWNISFCDVYLRLKDSEPMLFRHGAFRFTGSSSTLVIRR